MLNVGIIGFGLIGKSHFKLFVEGKINNAKVSAVAINGSKKFDETRLEVGPDCLIYTDYQLLLQDESIDIILITTPHLMHVEIIEDAVCNGKKSIV
jgi:predicted dehydrogenase